MKKEPTKEIRFKGQGLSSGVAIGKLFFFSPTEELSTSNPSLPPLSIRQIPSEIERYRNALENSRLDLRHLRERLESDRLPDGVDILDAQLQMMDDPLITQEVETDIRTTRHNAEMAFCQVIQRCEQRFRSLADPALWDRYRDVQDIAKRVLRYLRSHDRYSLADVPKDSIVFADELTASDTAEALEGAVSAFVTVQGGVTSHAAIVARAGNMPYVTHIDLSQVKDIAPGTQVVVDGDSGEVILSPSKVTLTHYRKLRRQQNERYQGLQEIGRLKAETYDGYPVRLSANLEIDSDLDLLHHYGSCGVGLFRSEYMMLTHEGFPSEAEQFICYRRIVKQMRGLPVIIRVFDVGGDKALGTSEWRRDLNPYLGWRAMRFLLREPQIFRTQLRAILRASAYGDVGIMFPLVTGLQELLAAKKLVEEARQQLIEEGLVFGKDVRIGCMIEVPSAAIVADLLAQECDFLSIGTNDLVQYSLAVDRGNPALSNHYTPTHPGIVRLIRLIVTEANRWKIPVTVCGEIAGDPRYTALLIGLGVHELSISPRRIPVIKHAIRRLSMVEAVELADQALGMTTAEDILDVLNQVYGRLVPEDKINGAELSCAEEPVPYMPRKR